jgi:predicted TPR repeat methyltransferase
MNETQSSPWLAIPLADYERHMSAASVAQAAMLSDTLHQLVMASRPKSLALLGSAGGNGLERIDPLVTRRVVAVDLNAAFLEACGARHAQRFNKFEPVHCDLSDGLPFSDPVDLVYAALVVEYLDQDAFLAYAPSLVTNDGRIAFVFQNRDERATPVSDSGVHSLQWLSAVHTAVDVDRLAEVLQSRDMKVADRRAIASAPGKLFTLLVVAKH